LSDEQGLPVCVLSDQQGLPEVQLVGAIACGFFFTIAYSEQLFIGGDH